METATSPSAIRFTLTQRADLRRLGVPQEAFVLLEAEAMPAGCRFLERRVTKNQVLAQLAKIDRELGKAEATIQALFDADAEDPDMAALVAARAWLQAGHPKMLGGIPLSRTAAHLRWSRKRIETAVQLVPVGPVRHETASPRPVELIHDALQMGAFHAGLDGLPKALWPSVAPKSKFRDVVCICYVAMDAPNPDPDRAIRAYVKVWRKLQQKAKTIAAAQNVPPAD